MIKKISGVITGAILFYGCYNHKEEILYGNNTCADVGKSFASDITPIVQSTCSFSSNCHGTGSTRGPGALTNYAQIKNAAEAVKTSVVTRSMPRGRTLTEAQINTISCWVDSGAPNN